jgi:hypothetical protein
MTTYYAYYKASTLFNGELETKIVLAPSPWDMYTKPREATPIYWAETTDEFQARRTELEAAGVRIETQRLPLGTDREEWSPAGAIKHIPFAEARHYLKP